jgi:hypothetical protein
MKNKSTMGALDAYHFLAYEHFPEEVPVAIRIHAAVNFVREFFAQDLDEEAPEDEFVEWATDLALRPLGDGSWVVVDLAQGAEPLAILEPDVEAEALAA